MSEPSRAPAQAAKPAPATPAREPERQNGSAAVGNLAVMQMMRSGAAGTAFAGTPLGNLDQQRSQPVRCESCAAKARRFGVQAKCAECDKSPQAKCNGCEDDSLAAVRPALSGASQSLPHQARIQASFGRHNLSAVRTLTGGDARRANQSIGARAFTSGHQIAFAAPPDEWLAAHESAHVIQQREGKKAPGDGGDAWEQHADRVADAVVQGRSAESLLDEVAGGDGSFTPRLQRDDEKGKKNDDDKADAGAGKSDDDKDADKKPGEGGGKPIIFGEYTLTNDEKALHEILRKEVISKKKAEAAKDFIGRFQTKYELPGGTPDPGSEMADAHAILETMKGALGEVETEEATFKEEFTADAKNVLDAMLTDSEKRVNEERAKYGLTETHSGGEQTDGGGGTGGAGGGGSSGGGSGGAPGSKDSGTEGSPAAPAKDPARTDYGMNDDIRTQGMAGAAKDLLAKRKEIIALEDQLSLKQPETANEKLARAYGPQPTKEELEERAAKEQQRAKEAEEVEKQIKDKQAQLLLLRHDYEAKYPILAAFAKNPTDNKFDVAEQNKNLETIGQGPNAASAQVLVGVLNDRLANIEKVRKGFPKQGDVWKLPTIIATTLKAKGYGPESFEAALAAAYMSSAGDDFTSLVTTVLTFELALVATVATGGVALAAGALMVAVDVKEIYHDVEQYSLQKAAANTDFDRARSASADDPSMFWLGLTIAVTVVADIAQLRTIFNGVKGLVAKAMAGGLERGTKEADEFRRAVKSVQGVTPELEEKLVQQVSKGAESKGAKTAEVLAEGAGHESQAVKEAAAASVERTKSLESNVLKSADMEAELEHLRGSGGFSGEPPFRTGQIGEHKWTECGPGKWCRESKKKCLILPEGAAPGESAVGQLGEHTPGAPEHKASAYQKYKDGGGVQDFEAWGEAYDKAVETVADAKVSSAPEVRAYRDLPEGALPEKYKMDPELVVDMPFVGKGKGDVNSAGWMRDQEYYWKEMMERHPEAFSEANKKRILGLPPHPEPRAPVNDPQFRGVFPQYDVKGLKGQPMIHHHIGGGGQAAGLPSPLHRGSGDIHNAEKAAGVWGRDDQVSDMLQRMLDAEKAGESKL